jgi:hypothetical protein
MSDIKYDDLTVVFLTANEHPEHWTNFHKEKLLQAIGSYPLITSSFKPLGFPGREIIQTSERSHYNMYRQLLKACYLAETPYIAVAESDTLYSPEHFTFYRPPMDAVAYDMSRWVLFTWRPVFSIRRRINNSMLIAPREYLIEALEERYGDNSKCPTDDRIGEVGRHIHEKALGLKLRNAIEVWCYHPSIQVSHENNISFKQAHHPYKKTLGEMKALEIPVWGKAEDLAHEYH